MKIDTLITPINGRYNAQVSIAQFTNFELDQIQAFGEPLIQIGGSFSGSISRPGQTNTTVALTGGGGSGATATVIVSDGSVTAINVTSGGTNYATAPLVIISGGEGSGVTATASVSMGSVTGVVVNTIGSGYGTPPAIIFSGGGGSGASATAVVTSGAISGLTITAPGSSYTVAPTVIISGDGSGATGTATILANVVNTLTVNSPGSGYNIVPISATFTLPTALYRMKTDFPAKQVFDLNDSVNADIMAQIWVNTVVANLTAAKQMLVAQTTPLSGETLTTV